MAKSLFANIFNTSGNKSSKGIPKETPKETREIYDVYIENQIDCYNSIADIHREYRKFRHDYKNIAIGLNALLEKGDYDAAKEYLRTSGEELFSSVSGNLTETGNPVINGLLEVKKAKAKAVNTKLEFMGRIPDDGFSPTDLCIVMENILDNAIAACAELNDEAEKVISIKALDPDNLFILTVKNSSPERRVEDEQVLTPDGKPAPGFGLERIRKVVEMHDGIMNIYYKNNSFTTEIKMVLSR